MRLRLHAYLLLAGHYTSVPCSVCSRPRRMTGFHGSRSWVSGLADSRNRALSFRRSPSQRPQLTLTRNPRPTKDGVDERRQQSGTRSPGLLPSWCKPKRRWDFLNPRMTCAWCPRSPRWANVSLCPLRTTFSCRGTEPTLVFMRYVSALHRDSTQCRVTPHVAFAKAGNNSCCSHFSL
jgi:hypothetical protein